MLADVRTSHNIGILGISESPHIPGTLQNFVLPAVSVLQVPRNTRYFQQSEQSTGTRDYFIFQALDTAGTLRHMVILTVYTPEVPGSASYFRQSMNPWNTQYCNYPENPGCSGFGTSR